MTETQTDVNLDELRKTAVAAIADYLDACVATGADPLAAMGKMMADLQARASE